MKRSLLFKKEAEADLNLTPFIDLLSTCVCFLLITAVWIQIGAMDIKQTSEKGISSASRKAVSLEMRFLSASRMKLKLKRGARVLRNYTVSSKSEDKLKEKLQAIMENKISKLQKKWSIESVLVVPHRKVNYGNAMSYMDILRQFGLKNMGFASGGGKV